MSKSKSDVPNCLLAHYNSGQGWQRVVMCDWFVSERERERDSWVPRGELTTDHTSITTPTLVSEPLPALTNLYGCLCFRWYIISPWTTSGVRLPGCLTGKRVALKVSYHLDFKQVPPLPLFQWGFLTENFWVEAWVHQGLVLRGMERIFPRRCVFS